MCDRKLKLGSTWIFSLLLSGFFCGNIASAVTLTAFHAKNNACLVDNDGIASKLYRATKRLAGRTLAVSY